MTEEKIQKYKEELANLIIKYQKEIHAGLLLQNAFHLLIRCTFESCSKDPEMAYQMILEILESYLHEYRGKVEIPNFPKNLFDRILYIKKFFKFPEKNNIQWNQDFCCFSGNIPSDIKFELTDFITNDRVTLRAYGYGIVSQDSKSYGSGAICANIKEIIPYMIEDREDEGEL